MLKKYIETPAKSHNHKFTKKGGRGEGGVQVGEEAWSFSSSKIHRKRIRKVKKTERRGQTDETVRVSGGGGGGVGQSMGRITKMGGKVGRESKQKQHRQEVL